MKEKQTELEKQEREKDYVCTKTIHISGNRRGMLRFIPHKNQLLHQPVTFYTQEW